MSEWLTAWEGKSTKLGIKGPPYRELGRDAEWKNCLVVVNREGKIVEVWNQWDKLFRRPHSVYISPYDPEKRVWVVDDNMQAIYIFTHDGKKLLQTIGTPEQEGADATHFNRPTYIDWEPNGDFFVSDGYTGTRVAKFDKNGKFLMQWGTKGGPRGTIRTPSMKRAPATSATCTASRWIRRRTTSSSTIATTTAFRSSTKTGSTCASGTSMPNRRACTCCTSAPATRSGPSTATPTRWWSTISRAICCTPGARMGMFPGGLWGVHGVSVDQEGNLYVAEVDAGRVQKFVPRKGANPEFLVAKPVKPVYSAQQ